MSVRVTERLIGDPVIVKDLPGSPMMIVQQVDEENKLVTTTWFSDHNEIQEGLFPGSALERVEPKPAPKAKAAASKKTGKKSR
ncbi:MAG: hypothetical protein FWD78_02080 [Treponema sp.]|nr:hypothetical protein [Treponema sp.]